MDDASRLTSQGHHAPSDTAHSAGSPPGILVFSTAIHLLYMNVEGRALCDRLTAQRLGRVANGVVPSEVLELCEEMVARLTTHTGPKDWEQFQSARVAGGPSCAVLLRGLGLPDPGGLSQGRLLILLEEMNQPRTATVRRAKDRFHLTVREQSVIIYLFKGLTNKEIASRMMVEEQTVKEHLRHIMEKTATTTRTGLLSKIILTDPEPGPQVQPSLPSPT